MLRCHPVEQAASEEEAILTAFDDEVATVDNKLGAFLDTEVDVTPYLVVMGFGYQRPHVIAGIHTVTHLEVTEFSFQFFDNRVGRIVPDAHGNRDRHATFAAGAVRRTHQMR